MVFKGFAKQKKLKPLEPLENQFETTQKMKPLEPLKNQFETTKKETETTNKHQISVKKKLKPQKPL